MQYKNAYWLWLSAAVILLDQVSKQLVYRNLDWFQSIPLMPSLNLVHLRNTGAAFSMFSNAPAWVFVSIGLVVSIGILIWLRLHRTDQRLVAVSLCLILGGALGNVIDRVTRGYVIDFIDFYVEYDGGSWHFAAFNVADMAITVGAGLMILDAILDWRRQRAAGAAA
jgi:signal peptidase II